MLPTISKNKLCAAPVSSVHQLSFTLIIPYGTVQILLLPIRIVNPLTYVIPMTWNVSTMARINDENIVQSKLAK